MEIGDLVCELLNELEAIDVNDETKKTKVTLAQVLLRGCIELLEGAALGADTEAYIIDHLKILASSDHGFLSRDKNLDDVLVGLEEEEQEAVVPQAAVGGEER